ncbi:MAG: amidohydrolase family protein [Nocardiopsaceae bacterium]|nr:amidohydrolase family protein [Nocardiopsaceae bacterium]
MPHRSPAMIAAPEAAAGRLWLTNFRLFDGTGSELDDGAAVLLEDGTVSQVTRAGDVPGAGDDRVLDLGGRVLMPGLSNAHVHAIGRMPEPAHGAEASLEGTPGHFMQAMLRNTLRMGVTTLRDTGAQGQLPQEARQGMRYGAFRGPRLLTCAKIISATAPGGRFYGTMYTEADGADGVRKAVREQIRWGADFVKVMTTGARSNELEDPDPTQFTDEEFAALVAEAHRMGFKVCAHSEGLPGNEAAIAHGMDTIEHGMYLNQRPDLLEKMAVNGQFLIPTLSGYYWMSGLAPDVIDPVDAQASPDMTPTLVKLAQYNLEQGAKSMRAARDLGVKIALGSDAKPEMTGVEILRMIHHGLTPMEVLVAATKTAAEALGISEQVGTVEPGKLADLVVVDGNPLDDPSVLTQRERIWLVFQLGEAVAGSALERSLDDMMVRRADAA